VTAAAASPVGAGTVIPAGAVQAGPVLLDDQSVWAESRPDGSLSIHAARPAGPDRVLLDFKASPDRAHFAASLAASSGRIVVTHDTADTSNGGRVFVGREVLVGSSPNDFTPVDPPKEDGSCGIIDADVDGALLATTRGNCPGAEVAVRVLSGTEPPRPLAWEPAGLHVDYDAAVKISGRYVAWLARGTDQAPAAAIVVFDRVADHEAYRIDVRPFMGGSAPVNYRLEFALQDDGTVVATVPNYDAGGIAVPVWASPGEPSPHALPVRLATLGVSVRDSLLAVRRLEDDSYAVIDLKGRVANVFDHDRWQDNGFDFDGKRVVWAQHAWVFSPGKGYADSYRIHNELYPVSPSTEVPGSSVTVGNDGIVSMPVWCPHIADPCSGEVGLDPGRTPDAVVHRAFKIGARKTKAVSVRLRSADVRRLKQRHKLKVTAVVQSVTAQHETRSTQSLVLRSIPPS
jgi:hypothetical protein